MAEEALDLWLSNECLVIKALIKLHESNPHIFKRNMVQFKWFTESKYLNASSYQMLKNKCV